MKFAHGTLMMCLLVSFGCGRNRHSRGDDSDGDSDSDIDSDSDTDTASDPCPGLLCCPGKDCPAGYICEYDQGICSLDPCGGAECCLARPCEGALLCDEGQCIEVPTVGQPCANNDQCTGPGAACFTETVGFPDGYCVQSCDAIDGCPGDSICVNTYCMDGCTAQLDCRFEYGCDPVTGGSVCRPQ